MVLDVTLFRTPEGVKIITESHRKRFGDPSIIEDIVDIDEKWRKVLFDCTKFSKLENMISKAIGAKVKGLKKAKKEGIDLQDQDTESVSNDAKQIDQQILDKLPDIEQFQLDAMSVDQLRELNSLSNKKKSLGVDFEKEYDEIRFHKLRLIGNLIHSSVPEGPDDNSNVIIEQTQIDSSVPRPHTHYELIEKINGTNYEAGSRIAGNRGYFLQGPCVFLSQALQQLGLHMLDTEGFSAIQTPYFMNEDIMADVAQLSQFDEELYKVSGSGTEENDKVKYLIATSEQPITALHAKETISESSLPIKYAGISTCFRKEAGRHGKDMSGIFRVHQFEKVEQFIICSSENDESWNYLEDLLNNSKSFLSVLELPYRVVNIASGELNLAAAKKYDIEGWFPGSKTYRELVSCSNCTDYHSRNLGIKHTSKSSRTGRYVHMLNGTMCAVTRMICMILENYQTPAGIIVPDALRKYMPERYRKLIPYV